jgi:hypothetical protein
MRGTPLTRHPTHPTTNTLMAGLETFNLALEVALDSFQILEGRLEIILSH